MLAIALPVKRDPIAFVAGKEGGVNGSLLSWVSGFAADDSNGGLEDGGDDAMSMVLSFRFQGQ